MSENLTEVPDVEALLSVQRRVGSALLVLIDAYRGSIGSVAISADAIVDVDVDVDRALADVADYFDRYRRRSEITPRWRPDRG